MSTRFPIQSSDAPLLEALLTGREPGWLERLPLLHLRQHMALIAMFDHDWGSTEAVRALVAPFRS